MEAGKGLGAALLHLELIAPRLQRVADAVQHRRHHDTIFNANDVSVAVDIVAILRDANFDAQRVGRERSRVQEHLSTVTPHIIDITLLSDVVVRLENVRKILADVLLVLCQLGMARLTFHVPVCIDCRHKDVHAVTLLPLVLFSIIGRYCKFDSTCRPLTVLP